MEASVWRRRITGSKNTTTTTTCTIENVIIQSIPKNEPAAYCNMLKCWRNASLVFFSFNCQRFRTVQILACVFMQILSIFQALAIPTESFACLMCGALVTCLRGSKSGKRQYYHFQIQFLATVYFLWRGFFSSQKEETLISCSPAQLLQIRRGYGCSRLKSVLVTTKGARCNVSRPRLGWIGIENS